MCTVCFDLHISHKIDYCQVMPYTSVFRPNIITCITLLTNYLYAYFISCTPKLCLTKFRSPFRLHVFVWPHGRTISIVLILLLLYYIVESKVACRRVRYLLFSHCTRHFCLGKGVSNRRLLKRHLRPATTNLDYSRY